MKLLKDSRIMGERRSYLSFRIGDSYFAADVKYVHNILEYSPITVLPRMPKHILGVINLRGEVLPVVDSRVKFGIRDTELSIDNCILVLEVTLNEEQVFAGFLVDAVTEVLEIEDEQINAPPGLGRDKLEDFISGFYLRDERYLMILNMDKVLSGDEIVDMSVLEEQA